MLAAPPPLALGAVLYVVLCALMGLAFGWLLRSLAWAVTLLFLLPLVVEPFLRLLLLFTPAFTAIAAAGPYLPFVAGSRLYTYRTDVDSGLTGAFSSTLSPLVGGLTLATVAAGLLALAHLLFQRRDA